MTLLRSDILTAVQADPRIATSVDTGRFNQWMNDWEEEATKIERGTNPLKNASTQDYSISTNPQTVTLPTAFQTMYGKGLGFFPINSDTNLPDSDRPLAAVSLSGIAAGYCETSAGVVIIGYAGRTVRLYYLATLDKPTTYDGTDTVPVADRFKEYPVSYCRYRWFTEQDLRDFAALEAAYLADRETDFRAGIKRSPSVISFASPADVIGY